MDLIERLNSNTSKIRKLILINGETYKGLISINSNDSTILDIIEENYIDRFYEEKAKVDVTADKLSKYFRHCKVSEVKDIV